MIATITLNPSLDEHVIVDKLAIEESNRVVELHRYAGGKGIDVSRAVHEMGGSTVAYGFVGGAHGRLLEILLDEEGVPFQFTLIEDETRANFIIMDRSTGQQTRIIAPGPRISERELERFIGKLRSQRVLPDILALGGSVPPGVPADIYYELISEAKELGIKTILDTAGHWLLEGLKARPYLIKPNVREAEAVLVRQLKDEEAIIRGARDLLEMGAEVAVISRGKDGLIAATGDCVIKAVPPPLKVVSAVGAGDCAIAGLALKLESNESLLEACRLAVAMGTAAVLTPGTELCHREDVERLVPQVQVRQIPTCNVARALS